MRALSASDVLGTFTAAGLVLSLTPENALKATPAKALTDDLRAAIRANKAMLVDYLQQAAANDATTTPAADPDRWCWSHSTAMNGQEIDTFTVRLARFTDKALTMAQAEQAADRLAIRDREGDDRALCLECTHLQGDVGRWRCSNSQAADVASDQLAPGLVAMLQRCPGFVGRVKSLGTSN